MFSMLDRSQGPSPVFRQTSRAPMALAPGIRTPSAFDQAMHQFGARLFEAAPGLVTWVLLLAPAWIPIIFPWPGAFVVAGGVLLFDVYWLGGAVTVGTGGLVSLPDIPPDIRIVRLGPLSPTPAQGPTPPP